jgi:NAD(P)-dependent dehydrogenase (short-subunit alcohol dehydrogenase family)
MKLNDSTILITGASSGLGLALADLLAQRGARLVIAARGDAALRTAAARLSKRTEVLAVTADVSEEAERIVAEGLSRFGRIDALVNNASELGPSPMPELAALDWEAFERILRVNAIAPLHLIQLLLPQMRERGAGTIINISSDAGVNAYPGWGGYGASKAALEHLSRTLNAELEDTGIRVLAVDPGDMNTTMHQLAEPGVDLSELAKPEQVAPAIIALLENDAPAGRYQAQELAYAVR